MANFGSKVKAGIHRPHGLFSKIEYRGPVGRGRVGLWILESRLISFIKDHYAKRIDQT